MIRAGKILLVIGVLLGTFSAVIPFTEILIKDTANILYNRGMLLGFMLSAFGGVLITWKDKRPYISSMLFGLSSGIFGELSISSYNLLCDACIATFYYFLVTFIVSFSAFIVVLILRLCSKQ